MSGRNEVSRFAKIKNEPVPMSRVDVEGGREGRLDLGLILRLGSVFPCFS